MGLRGIERVTDIHHTTVMHWIRAAGHEMKDTPESEEIPEITDVDELQTFVGNKPGQTVDMDSSKPQATWNFGMGNR